MIEGSKYIKTAKEYYSFLSTEFDLSQIHEEIRGNVFYDLQYGDETKIISISYENIEEYFQVIIFILQNGQMPDYDDKSKTLHLNKINALVLSTIDKSEIDLNNKYFIGFKPQDEVSKKLLKAAKELRLSMKHFSTLEEL